jgi:MFS transporter, DHA1 family, multidrug resistance protein
MTQKQKNGIIVILGILSAIGPFSIDMYLSGFPSIAKDFHTDISHVALSLTSYFIGISFGQIIYGPLLDRFGRKKPLLIGLIIYSISALACAFSPTIYALIGARLLLALGGCVGMVAGRAIIRDIFKPEETANAFSTLLLVMAVSPIIAPTLGGFITSYAGWRFIFFLLSGFSLVMVITISLWLPETSMSNKNISLKIKNIVKDYIVIFKEPTFLTYALAGGIASAAMFSYISGASFVYMNLFGFSASNFGLLFGMNAFGLVSGGQLNRFLLKKLDSKKIVLIMGLLLTITGILLIIVNIFKPLSVYGTIGLIFLFLLFLGFMNPNTAALALNTFTSKNAGTASALLGSIQMVTSAIMSILVSRLHNNTAFPMVSIMAGCAAISFLIFAIKGLTDRKNPKITPEQTIENDVLDME